LVAARLVGKLGVLGFAPTFAHDVAALKWILWKRPSSNSWHQWETATTLMTAQVGAHFVGGMSVFSSLYGRVQTGYKIPSKK
jgi:hypothetical protein